jgi:S-adenosylmethionine synthetase
MYFFTSESVSEGHPDKIADQISDAILDNILEKDNNAAVACETLVKNSLVILAGEINTNIWIDTEEIVKNVLKDIGYDCHSKGLDYKTATILNLISKQSTEINQTVFSKSNNCVGAGDQGIMFGFACDETETYMPAPIFFANQILLELSHQRKSSKIEWLSPDAKSQVTVEYDGNGGIKRIDTILVSTQHKKEVTHKEIVHTITNLIKNTFPTKLLDKNTKYIINPSGSFILGGPYADCGLTGRKIIVDTYGGYSKHGGGAFSGKDPSKVDRSASYVARYIAKNIVASGLAKKCEIQLSYAIGIADPLSIHVNTFGTSKVSELEYISMIKKVFPLKPKDIIDHLKLKTTKYLRSAAYGHFGRNVDIYNWEKLDKIETIKKEIK